jgi:hypothetical protein
VWTYADCQYECTSAFFEFDPLVIALNFDLAFAAFGSVAASAFAPLALLLFPVLPRDRGQSQAK